MSSLQQGRLYRAEDGALVDAGTRPEGVACLVCGKPAQCHLTEVITAHTIERHYCLEHAGT